MTDVMSTLSPRDRRAWTALIASIGTLEAPPEGIELDVHDTFAGPAATAPFEGVIGVESLLTGDGRLIEHGALTWAQFPLPLRWAVQDVGGHDGAVIIGRIDRVERRENGDIYAWGVIDLGSPEGREAARLMRGQFLSGVSMDLDTVNAFEAEVREFADGDEVIHENVTVTDDARVRAATLVAIPAFDEARLSLVASMAGDAERRVALGHGAFSVGFDDESAETAAFRAGKAEQWRRHVAERTQAETLAAELADFAPAARESDEFAAFRDEFAVASWRGQWRNPRNGQWIDMPGAALSKLGEILDRLGSPKYQTVNEKANAVDRALEAGDLTAAQEHAADAADAASWSDIAVPEAEQVEWDQSIEALDAFQSITDLSELGGDTGNVDIGDLEGADFDDEAELPTNAEGFVERGTTRTGPDGQMQVADGLGLWYDASYPEGANILAGGETQNDTAVDVVTGEELDRPDEAPDAGDDSRSARDEIDAAVERGDLPEALRIARELGDADDIAGIEALMDGEEIDGLGTGLGPDFVDFDGPDYVAPDPGVDVGIDADGSITEFPADGSLGVTRRSPIRIVNELTRNPKDVKNLSDADLLAASDLLGNMIVREVRENGYDDVLAALFDEERRRKIGHAGYDETTGISTPQALKASAQSHPEVFQEAAASGRYDFPTDHFEIEPFESGAGTGYRLRPVNAGGHFGDAGQFGSLEEAQAAQSGRELGKQTWDELGKRVQAGEFDPGADGGDGVWRAAMQNMLEGQKLKDAVTAAIGSRSGDNELIEVDGNIADNGPTQSELDEIEANGEDVSDDDLMPYERDTVIPGTDVTWGEFLDAGGDRRNTPTPEEVNDVMAEARMAADDAAAGPELPEDADGNPIGADSGDDLSPEEAEARMAEDDAAVDELPRGTFFNGPMEAEAEIDGVRYEKDADSGQWFDERGQVGPDGPSAEELEAAARGESLDDFAAKRRKTKDAMAGEDPVPFR